MNPQENSIQYFKDGISFSSQQAAMMRDIYMPLCSPKADGIKSSITPFLSGDIKQDKTHYLTKPMSRQDLRNPVRNFFIRTHDGEVFSLLDRESDDAAQVYIGQLWHCLINTSQRLGLTLEALNFVPICESHVEIMRVTICNTSQKILKLVPTGSIPIFGRSLVNKHDHEHVTSLLHRTQQLEQGIVAEPTMAFNEEGHQEADARYFVLGADDSGASPIGSFPVADEFLGSAGVWERPEAVIEGKDPQQLSSEYLDGKEVAGAIRFKEVVIAPGEKKSYILIIGLGSRKDDIMQVYHRFDTQGKVEQAFQETKDFWENKSNAIVFGTSHAKFDSWMRWVMIQPVLRRIFGCSFLPDHDYGKGGKGWRDLWQDLLSLILIEPQSVRQLLINNFAGVRIDGTNATIIGSGQGEFLADRNAITRVWMDHGAWPVLTMLLYINETGDTDIVFEKNAYFRDMQLSRTLRKDRAWNPKYGNCLRTQSNKIYQGTLLEHMLVQTLTQFFNVGEHHMLRLESADWNDGLDMASDRGESVAFSSFYAGNLAVLADLLEYLKERKGVETITVFKELGILLDSAGGHGCDYDDLDAKKHLLFEKYFSDVEPEISGETVDLQIEHIIYDLRQKSEWLFRKIRSQEKVNMEYEGRSYEWFNGYYDNQAQAVEGIKDGVVRMTLTGQVFAIMSGMADHHETAEIVKSVDAFLKDPQHGGVRLNTDFQMRNYLDLGRAFSFAYGTKENGAVFSHMAVMYAYALYQQGFVREGFNVIDALHQMADRFETSRIYPNIPEYFDRHGQGMYAYLTGSASWLVLTMLTQVFGVRGAKGDLLIQPKLVKEQFSQEGVAYIMSSFAGKRIRVFYHNASFLDAQDYEISSVKINGGPADIKRIDQGTVCIERQMIEDAQSPLKIDVELTKRSS